MKIPKKAMIVTGVLLFAFGVFEIIGNVLVKPNTPVGVQKGSQDTVDTSPTIEGLWIDTNRERVNNGLPALNLNNDLTAVATARCVDMVKQHYYSHNNPQGVTPQDFIQKVTPYPITRYYSGENIAKGIYTNESVTAAWMASPEHRENILKPQYTQVGYAVCTDENSSVYIVQDFLSDVQ